MLHWTPARTAAFSVTPIGTLLGASTPSRPSAGGARSDHARMLAYAATRRHAAQGVAGADWKACAPAAIAKAAEIRAGAGFSRLP